MHSASRLRSLVILTLVMVPVLTGCGLSPSPLSEAAKDRLKVFDDYSEALQENYPYFHLKGIDWESLAASYRPAVVSVESSSQFHHLLAALLAELDDPHVSLKIPNANWDAGDIKSTSLLDLEGFQIALLDRRCFVTQWPEGMAPLAPEHLPEELQRFPELIRVQGARLTLPLFRVLARGDAESLVELQLCWADGTKTRHTLRRPRPKPLLQDDIDLADERITKVRFDGDKSKSRLHRLASLERTGTHAILRWKTMSLKSTGSDRSQLSNHVIRLLEGVAPTDGLIIDLRVNHGGQLHVALDVLAHFLTSEIKIVGPHEKLDYLGGLISLSLFGTWPVKPREPRFTFPVVVLTSWQTGSAAELFARLMQKQQGATLVGERTIGAEHPDTLVSVNNLGLLLKQKGD